MLMYSILSPHLDYCNSTLTRLCDLKIDRLKPIQNGMAHFTFICNMTILLCPHRIALAAHHPENTCVFSPTRPSMTAPALPYLKSLHLFELKMKTYLFTQSSNYSLYDVSFCYLFFRNSNIVEMMKNAGFFFPKSRMMKKEVEAKIQDMESENWKLLCQGPCPYPL